MIAYLCPDNAAPSGGVKTQYRHVEILAAAGYDACVLHPTPGFRPTWFDSTAPIRYIPDTPLNPATDLLVVPEIFGPGIADLGDAVPKVIFNQNVHYTFRGYPVPPSDGTPWPYEDPRVLGVLVLTDYERDFLQPFMPNTPVFTVRHGIDPAMFHPPGPDDPPKKRQICYMPRKHPDEAQAVFGWLWASGALKGWRVVPIDGQTERETAQIFRESQVFFAFGYPEGGTLPPFEAMASGCVVIGYGGFASDEDLIACAGEWISCGDTVAFAKQAEALLREPARTGIKDLVLWRFSMDDERTALLEAMDHVGGRQPVAV